MFYPTVMLNEVTGLLPVSLGFSSIHTYRPSPGNIPGCRISRCPEIGPSIHEHVQLGLLGLHMQVPCLC